MAWPGLVKEIVLLGYGSSSKRHRRGLKLQLVFHFSGCIVSSSGAQFTCGQFVYDARRFICCENTDLCKRDGTRDCCGRFCYNPTIGMCCKGRIRDRCDSKDASCCGDRCYSKKKQMCCNGKVVARCAGSESTCCGTGCYNPRWKQCKNGKIIFPQKSTYYY
ncbi:hypothetical protein T03_16731 [Trichinella britovi]|uniref:Galaxin-like repeats domain-containing protein n=2 Tax=Trichinella TaxID=6333 RepID=A0A0V1D7Z4_TRIBR|nr:hypothetical protein T05_7773 [Trichinella murrelli]KRY57665.1 hypothetical protein T03_16731 [Trichinella britovi]